eukprot:SAG31_NODE_35747_length_320_cov_0.809955_1_plen_46_part_10
MRGSIHDRVAVARWLRLRLCLEQHGRGCEGGCTSGDNDKRPNVKKH